MLIKITKALIEVGKQSARVLGRLTEDDNSIPQDLCGIPIDPPINEDEKKEMEELFEDYNHIGIKK